MNAMTTIKNVAATAAIAGALSVAGLGLANGIAAAAPADHAGSESGASTKSEKHAHLIPGFTPKPAQETTAPSLGPTSNDSFDPNDPDNPENCHAAR